MLATGEVIEFVPKVAVPLPDKKVDEQFDQDKNPQQPVVGPEDPIHWHASPQCPPFEWPLLYLNHISHDLTLIGK